MKMRIMRFCALGLAVLFAVGVASCSHENEEPEPIINPDTPATPGGGGGTPPTGDTKAAKRYTAVDMGLSVKWADRNLDASSPEDWGAYYAWGEINAKSYYSLSNYIWYQDGEYTAPGGESNIQGTANDAVRMKLGGTWRMPMKNEIDALVRQCSWTWTRRNGADGYLVTAPNGNSIFLPAAGYRDGTETVGRGQVGAYWSSTRYSGKKSQANNLYFSFESRRMDVADRYIGLVVRPVKE